MPSTPASEPTPAPPGAPLRRRESPHELAARVLVLVLGCLGAAITALAVVEFASGHTSALSGQRLLIALGLLGAAGLGQALRRTGRPRAASVLTLAVALLTLALHALHVGLGVHTLSLVAATLTIVLGGALAGSGAAWLLTALYGAAVATLGLLEARGIIPGQAAPLQVTLADRLVGHALVAGTALLGALLIHRIVGAALRQALGEEERLSRLVHAAHNWAWEADEHFHVTSLSDEFEALSGHKREDFLRMGEPGGAQLVRDADYQLLLEDVRARRPYRDRVNGFRVADGRLLWTLTSGEPVFDAAGRHIGWRGVSHNITGERLALQQHQRTAGMLDRVLRASPDAICVARIADGRILFANAGFCTLVHRSRDELIGRSARELGLWPDRTEPARMAAALAGSGLVRDLRSGVLVNGQWRDLLVSAATLDWEGEAATVIISRDITDRERARIEAEALLDHASVGIALMRGDRFERVNRHWRDIFGGTEPHPADAGHHLPAARGAAPHALAFERDCLRPDGERITVRFSARGLPDPMADQPGAGATEPATLWVAEDVTERRRQERELQAAKAQAEAASHAKSAFLATMSHEIRTPLNGVVGLARLLQQPEVDDVRRSQYLAHLAGAAESLNEIVSNVLDLSKMEAGHLALERLEFDLHALAQASFEGGAALGRERGLDMRIDLAPGLPRVVIGDPLRVRQIMANFLSNALKFTERGHIRLAVSPAGAGRVRIAVEDSGIGVPPALQARLFRPFAQADDSTTRRFGGTGLGLSICRELAQRMDGQVGMASDGQHGATFWADLALPAATPAAEAAVRPPGPAARHPLAGQRLLVAEDNPVNRLIIGALLQRLGAEVVEAEDGEQAVALARAQAGRLDAVLMDLHMPKIDGLRATELLRADPATARLPIHAFTAAVLEQERHAALAAGMDGFIAKPVAEADVIRVLGRT